MQPARIVQWMIVSNHSVWSRTPPARRAWLFANALRSLSFDRANRVGTHRGSVLDGRRIPPPSRYGSRLEWEPNLIENVDNTKSKTDESTSAPLPVKQAAHKPRPLEPRRSDRDRLLDRLAEGVRNAEPAAEFSLHLKQVQGGPDGLRSRNRRASRAAQQKARARRSNGQIESLDWGCRAISATQDDVVVPQENSEFLVNGRFQMPLSDLVARANRMRRRQGKPAFELENTTAGPVARLNIANGQALC